MASKWKYADLPASERLDMIRNGNKDVYDNEVARSLDKIKTNQANGLSTDDQKAWLDTLSYNYNLGAASQIAPGSKVNKTGYTDVYFGLGNSGSKKSKKSDDYKVKMTSSGQVQFDYEAEKVLREYMGIFQKLEEDKTIGEEWLLNNGIDKNSETGKKYLDVFSEQLQSIKDKYYNEYISKVKDLAKKYL